MSEERISEEKAWKMDTRWGSVVLAQSLYPDSWGLQAAQDCLRLLAERQHLLGLLDLERLAALEHEQWVSWSMAVGGEVSPKRWGRWSALWVPYAELTEGDKEDDRVWARKVRGEEQP